MVQLNRLSSNWLLGCNMACWILIVAFARNRTHSANPKAQKSTGGEFEQWPSDLGPAVVQDSLQMAKQHVGQLLHGLEPLPAQLIDPALQVAHHSSLVAIAPQPVQ